MGMLKEGRRFLNADEGDVGEQGEVDVEDGGRVGAFDVAGERGAFVFVDGMGEMGVEREGEKACECNGDDEEGEGVDDARTCWEVRVSGKGRAVAAANEMGDAPGEEDARGCWLGGGIDIVFRGGFAFWCRWGFAVDGVAGRGEGKRGDEGEGGALDSLSVEGT